MRFNTYVPILGRVTINGTVAQFNSKQTIPKTLWYAKGNRAKGKSAEARNINLALDNIKAQIIKHYQRISDREAYVTGERRKAKKGQEDGKRKYRKKTNSVRLCADDLFNRQTLVAYHDNYARVMAKCGLQRGVRGSEARHTTTQYYRDMKKKNEALEAETRLLQEKKTEAQEELKQVKAEIRTDKLKCATTDTATALASSVGSLFGSGKMKSLERRNEDLQDRILELEEEARQREWQHTKRIEEITDAYEKRHRKMSELADFVKRYFPYVEKLMPVINFLRDRLGVNDSIIQRLCAFKDVPITGKLHSSEFNQSFEAKRSVCSIKEDENGKFDFTIDGVSHVSWFRRKRDEFMEAIGIPKPSQPISGTDNALSQLRPGIEPS